MPSLRTILATAAMAYLANAKTIKITATKDNTFDPESVTAEKGDIVEFHFQPKNHSVVSGEYEWPCSPQQILTGFYSGFVSTDDNEADRVFQVTINSTDPIPFFSSQGDECPKGMVGMINPSSNKTLEDYKKRAGALASGVSPGRESFGGELIDSDDADKKSDDKDEKKDGKDNSSDDSKDGSGDKDAAGSVRVPLFSLLGAVGLVFFMA